MGEYLSCYKTLPAGSIAGGLGQGGGFYWQEDVGITLQAAIAQELGLDIIYDPRPHGQDSFDLRAWLPPIGDYEVAYVQLFDIPERRPAEFVWSIISDYVHMEAVLEAWLAGVRPNLLVTFQYPLYPPERIPSLPHIALHNLVDQCAKYGCEVVHWPWFNTRNITSPEVQRDIPGMCTGKMSGTYPMRDAIYRYLEEAEIEGVILSGNPHGSTFKLSDQEYRDALRRARYYFSGGIYDFQVPPKYYEVCNYGACLVSPAMPMMAACGFVGGETYVQIESVDQIPDILASDVWQRIGPAAREMVHRTHSLEQRAADIAGTIRRLGG